jgi:hypothetical protein
VSALLRHTFYWLRGECCAGGQLLFEEEPGRYLAGLANLPERQAMYLVMGYLL